MAESPIGLPVPKWAFDGDYVASTRFWSMVDEVETGCWLWRGNIGSHGYGSFLVAGEQFKAHRLSWFLTTGAWPEQSLDHLCRVRSCVNPDHLEDVDHRTNVMRGVSPFARNAAKTHCPQGHPFSQENTLIVNRGASRKCRTCHRRQQRETVARRREELRTHR